MIGVAATRLPPSETAAKIDGRVQPNRIFFVEVLGFWAIPVRG